MAALKLDANVPVVAKKKSRKRKEDPRAAQLLAMDIDKGRNSFFLPGAVIKDVRSLRALAKRIGVALTVREFAEGEDPIVKDKAGVRVWRVTPPDEDF